MIYNCTPPDKNKLNIDKDIEYHVKIINQTNPEMVGIYDIICEKNRNGTPRPYEQRKHMNTYLFAELLHNIIPKIPIIIYRSVKRNETYDDIINDIKKHQIDFSTIVIVGNSENTDIHTNTLISHVITDCNVKVGCVLLPERKNEIEICLERIRIGVSFFISQIVISPEYIYPFLEKLPVRIWTTIIPIKNTKTSNMYNWLNGTNYEIDLEIYPKSLIDSKLTDICFETISYIHSSNMIEFIKQFDNNIS
jgi:hypothetical protein